MQGAHGDKVVMAPNAHYDTGWLHRVFFGSHYRDLWATPIELERLDLATEAGGLTPTGRGGGQQTCSLRFKGRDGRVYVARSVDKDPSAILPPELRGTVANSIVRDQISASHPAGALVVTPLVTAAGVPHTNPRLLQIPPDAELGSFSDFAGMVVLFEERPGTGEDDLVVPGAVRVINSDNLFKRVEDSSKDQVDAEALLRARLMDAFLGDWDRHRDQWRWATFDSSAPRRWRPVPRDRDQAFVRFDGLLLAIARSQAPQLVNFGPKYPGMTGLTWNGRELDRRFLVGLEKPVWERVASEIQGALTDSVIAEAVAAMPVEFQPLDSARLTDALRGRRDRLPEAARRFYRLLAGEVDVHATDEADLVVIDADGAQSALVTIAPRKGGSPWYSRRFHKGETGELRLYLHGGADSVMATGKAPFTVRIIGGKGQDAVTLEDGARARLYDTDSLRAAPGQRVRKAPVPHEWLGDSTRLPPRDWGSVTYPVAWASLAPDVGLLLGGGVLITDYGFRQQPWASRHLVRAGYATDAQSGKVEYVGDFRSETRGPWVGVHAFASGIEVLRFHGIGNETTADGPDQFFRVRENDLHTSVTLNLPAGTRGHFSVGPVVTWSSTRFTGDRFIDSVRPYGSGNFGRVGVLAGFHLDTRDRPGYPRKGVLLDVGGTVRPGIWDVTSTYGEVHGVVSTYLSPKVAGSPVLALRVGGQQTFGDFIYQDAAYIGGAGTVRLSRLRRFAGDASVYGTGELRFALTRFRVIVPGELGLFGLGDVGRVFVDGESSDKWHGAVGGGVWVAFLSRNSTMSVAVAKSEEGTRVFVQGGWPF
jgi:hypothetical protein